VKERILPTISRVLKPGWITAEIWGKWIQDVFIPHVEAVRKEIAKEDGKNNPKSLLYLDSHASRLNVAALKTLEDYNITAVTIPSHTSHIMQPLDCGVNNKLKRTLRSLSNQGKVVWNQGLERYRSSILDAVLHAAYDAHNPYIAREAFRCTG
jgi:hypothetical protein